jgi:hypothetical protein
LRKALRIAWKSFWSFSSNLEMSPAICCSAEAGLEVVVFVLGIVPRGQFIP